MPHCLARGASTKENTSKATSLAKGRWFHTKNLCSTLYTMGHRNIGPVGKLQGLEDSERPRGWYAWVTSTRLHYHYGFVKVAPVASPHCVVADAGDMCYEGEYLDATASADVWHDSCGRCKQKSLDLQGLKTWNGQVHLARWKVL